MEFVGIKLSNVTLIYVKLRGVKLINVLLKYVKLRCVTPRIVKPRQLRLRDVTLRQVKLINIKSAKRVRVYGYGVYEEQIRKLRSWGVGDGGGKGCVGGVVKRGMFDK